MAPTVKSPSDIKKMYNLYDYPAGTPYRPQTSLNCIWDVTNNRTSQYMENSTNTLNFWAGLLTIGTGIVSFGASIVSLCNLGKKDDDDSNDKKTDDKKTDDTKPKASNPEPSVTDTTKTSQDNLSAAFNTASGSGKPEDWATVENKYNEALSIYKQNEKAITECDNKTKQAETDIGTLNTEIDGFEKRNTELDTQINGLDKMISASVENIRSYQSAIDAYKFQANPAYPTEVVNQRIAELERKIEDEKNKIETYNIKKAPLTDEKKRNSTAINERNNKKDALNKIKSDQPSIKTKFENANAALKPILEKAGDQLRYRQIKVEAIPNATTI